MKTTTLFVVIYREKGEALWKIAGDDFYESYETTKEQEDLFRSSCFVKTLNLGCEVKIVPLHRWFYINEEQRKLHNKGANKVFRILERVVSEAKKYGDLRYELIKEEKSFRLDVFLDGSIEIFPIDEDLCKIVVYEELEGPVISKVATYKDIINAFEQAEKEAIEEEAMKEVRL